MFEVRFLIPRQSNDGVRFSPRHHEQFNAHVAERFGGFTRYGAASGGWISSEGRMFIDDHIVYSVALVSLLDASKLGDLVAFIKTHYQQEAVYITYLGQAEIL